VERPKKDLKKFIRRLKTSDRRQKMEKKKFRIWTSKQ
jgi:hypothetical protein